MFKRLLNHSLVFWIAGLVILIDQYAKYLVRANLVPSLAQIYDLQ